MDLLAYWKLLERPFEATWDTRFFYQSPAHDEALNRLCFLVGERSMNLGLLTGEIGCGKTLTRAVFSERLDHRRFQVTTRENSGFPFKDLLSGVLQALEGTPEPPRLGRFNLCERLRLAVESNARQDRHLVMVFDEAQEMTPATLNELKLLTNLNGAGQSYLTIILLGQPELRTKVAGLPAINQRISLRFHLQALGLEETSAYLQHRLKVAGHPSGDLFPAGAVERLYQAAQGVPRQINRVAKLALEQAWLLDMERVEPTAVDAVVADLQRHQNLAPA
jgi:general secretion pathway protein A